MTWWHYNAKIYFQDISWKNIYNIDAKYDDLIGTVSLAIVTPYSAQLSIYSVPTIYSF